MESNSESPDFPAPDYHAERKLVAGFIVALIILAGMVLYSHYALQKLIRYRNETLAGHQFINHLNQLLIFIQDMESNERAFLLSGDGEFLKNYSSSEKQIAPELARLRHLLGRDSRRTALVDELARLVDAKMRVMQDYLDSRRADTFLLETSDAPLQEGRRAMAAIRQSVNKLRSVTQQRMFLVEAKSEGGVDTTHFLGFASNLVVLGLVVLVMFVFKRDMEIRQRTQQAIQSLHLRLQSQVRELNEVNQELEAFSYSVSHDLRAPLRHIDGFVNILQKNKNGQLDPPAQRYLTLIADSAKHMGVLVDDLLAFSRMSREEMRMVQVPMDRLVENVKNSLTKEHPDRKIEWRIGPLPDLRADPSLLRQVWINLLGNAVKYTRDREVAVIEVACEPSEKELVFSVKDNGAGFDMKYVNKLFGVFQRLHRADQFEGTGIGLANVRRIVSRHHGRTWAIGQLNVGATFYFSLPSELKAHAT